METLFEQISTGELSASVWAALATIASVVAAAIGYWTLARDGVGFLKDVQNFVLRRPGKDAVFEPRLSLRETTDAGAARRFFFGSAERVPFRARDRELTLLRSWLEDKKRFSWTMLRGPGGQGKSRLAAELCRSLLPKWNAGFLIDGVDDDPSRYADFYPTKPHLIVIDYVASRAEKVGQLIRNLSAHCEDSPFRKCVRILLIEREGRTSHWWRDFVATAELETMELCAHEEDTEPGITIAEMGEANLVAIVGHVSGRYDLDYKQTATQLRKIDPRGRPLFAELLGDALRTDPEATFSTQGALLDAHLAREWRRWERVAGRDSGVLYRHMNAASVATIAGGVSFPILLSDELKAAFPFDSTYRPDIIREMTGRSDRQKVAPVEPDIVGEWLVLRHLQYADLNRLLEWPTEDGPTGQIREALKWMTVANPEAFAHMQAFRVRLALDFPDEPYKADLFPVPTTESPSLALHWVRATLAILEIYSDKEQSHSAAAVWDQLGEMLAKSPEAPSEVRQVLIQSLLFGSCALQSVLRGPRTVIAIVEPLASSEIFTKEFPDDPLIAIGRINFAIALIRCFDPEPDTLDEADEGDWRRMLALIREIAAPFLDTFAVRNRYADCLYFLAAADRASAFHELNELRQRAPDDTVLAMGLAHTAMLYYELEVSQLHEHLFDSGHMDQIDECAAFAKAAMVEGPWGSLFGPEYIRLGAQAVVLRALSNAFCAPHQEQSEALDLLSDRLQAFERFDLSVPNRVQLLNRVRQCDGDERNALLRKFADAALHWKDANQQRAINDALRATRKEFLRKAHTHGFRVFDSYSDLMARSSPKRAA